MLQKNKHVIFCTSGIFPATVGGIQRHSRLLIEELAKMKTLQLTVIHPHKQHMFEKQFEINEILIPFDFSKGNYLHNCYKYSKLVYQKLIQFPDAVIYAQGITVWYGIKKIGHRLVYNPHGLEPFQGITSRDHYSTLPFRIAMRYLFRHTAYVVSLGGKLTDILIKKGGVKPSHIQVLPNAVNLPAPFHKNENHQQLNFLFVGRFAHNKGIDLLLETIRELNSEGYENKMHFSFVGKGPLYDQLTREYNFSNLYFAGFADDEKLLQLYLESDVFVFPTLFEGMPTVVLEAMCYQMPVIVSDVGATAELVDNSNGILIEKNNKVQLKQAIIKMFEMPVEERNLKALASVEKVKQRFTWQQVALAHGRLFEKMHLN